jgi:hypothetical protein
MTRAEALAFAKELMAMLMFGGHLNTTHEVRKFVLGFN